MYNQQQRMMDNNGTPLPPNVARDRDMRPHKGKPPIHQNTSTSLFHTAEAFEPLESRQDNFYNVFKPYMVIAKCFGSSYRPPGSKWRPALSAYSLFTFFVVAFCMCRGLSFLRFELFSARLVFKCLVILYATHCMTSFLMLFWAQRRALPQFVHTWRTINGHDDTTIPHFKFLMGCTFVGVSYVIGVSIVNGLFVGLGSEELWIRFPFMESYVFDDRFDWFNGVIVGYTSVPFSLAQMCYCSVCLVVYCEFRHFNTKLQQLSRRQLVAQLPRIRATHNHISELTDQANGMLNRFAIGIYALNIPTLIITSFVLTREWNTMDGVNLFTFVTWVGVLLLQMSIVSLAPALVHHQVVEKGEMEVKEVQSQRFQAHEPVQLLQDISNQLIETGSPPHIFHELSMFIAHLTRDEIGLTAGTFFIITKSQLLTLASVVITYFAIIIQFDMAAEVPCVCNC